MNASLKVFVRKFVNCKCYFSASVDMVHFTDKMNAVDIPQFLFRLLPRCYPARFCEPSGTKGKPAISLRQRTLFWLREPDATYTERSFMYRRQALERLVQYFWEFVAVVTGSRTICNVARLDAQDLFGVFCSIASSVVSKLTGDTSMQMTFNTFTVKAFAVALALSTVMPSFAQADAMSDLVAAAKAEGQLTTIALPHDWCGYGDVIAGFKAKYPEITVNELNPDAGSADELEAIRANKDNKGPQAPDVIEVGLAFGPQAKTEGLIQPYKVSTWAEIPDNLKDAEGFWYGDYYGVMAFGVNTDLVKNVPADWADLLKPEYANLVALTGDPRSSNQVHVKPKRITTGFLPRNSQNQ
jgi:Bacterial extracellular solute-binding protein